MERLFATVVDGGYCVGCGACAAVADAPIEMAFDDAGRLQARLAGPPDDSPVLDVCPFAEGSAEEDVLAAERFGDLGARDDRIGHHLGTYAGWALGDERTRGSSGGLTSWFLAELLRRDVVDGVLHVRPAEGERLFAFGPSLSLEELQAGAKTRYYPVEMSEVLRLARERPGRYALVGVPSFVKAVRRISRVDPVLDERLVVTVALVCGHLKSASFARSLAWQAGLEPDGLTDIDFRHKLAGRPANRYGTRLVGTPLDGVPGRDAPVEVTRPMSDFEGADWGQGYFKYSACDFCDDVLGETADVTFGDAWLPQYTDDHLGANVVVTRRPELDAILTEGRDAGAIHLDDLSADDVARSQAAGLRHRREGLAYRLARADAAGRWRPPKRVEPQRAAISRTQRRIFDLRVELVAASHRSFAAALKARDYAVHHDTMAPLVARYRALYARRSLRQRVRRRARLTASAVLRPVRRRRR